VTVEVIGVSRMGNHLFLDDASGNNPLRIYVHAHDMAIEQRRLRVQSATSHTHGEHAVALYRIEMKRGNVYQHILTMVLRIIVLTPTASLYVAE